MAHLKGPSHNDRLLHLHLVSQMPITVAVDTFIQVFHKLLALLLFQVHQVHQMVQIHHLHHFLAKIQAHHFQLLAKTQATAIIIQAMIPTVAIETHNQIHTIHMPTEIEIHRAILTAIKRKMTIQDHLGIFSAISSAAVAEEVACAMAAEATQVDPVMEISLAHYQVAAVLAAAAAAAVLQVK